MSDQRNAFHPSKHRAVKDLKHKELVIYVSTDDIFEARAKYGQAEHWKYIEDQFMEKHGVRIIDRDKLVLYTTVVDDVLKITGHIGYSLSERKA